MTPEQRFVTGVLLALLLAVVFRLVRRHHLGVSLGLLWSGLLFGALMVLVVPGLLDGITTLTRAKFPVSAMTLLTLVIMTLFLFYFSLLIQRLERKYAQLVRSIALMEHRLRNGPLSDQGFVTAKEADPTPLAGSESSRLSRASITAGRKGDDEE